MLVGSVIVARPAENPVSRFPLVSVSGIISAATSTIIKSLGNVRTFSLIPASLTELSPDVILYVPVSFSIKS